MYADRMTLVLYSVIACGSLLIIYQSSFTAKKLSQIYYSGLRPKLVAAFLDSNGGFSEHSSHSKHSIQEKFVQMRVHYDKTLSTRPRSDYNDSSQFVDFGPSLADVADANAQKNVSDKAPKLVLLWTTYHTTVMWMPRILCPDKELKCVVSTKKSDLTASDAVMMYFGRMVEMPAVRLSNQRWVIVFREPPHITQMKFNCTEFNGIFNWTHSYRSDADFYGPYFNTVPRTENWSYSQYKSEIAEIMAKKTKLVAIASSHCKPRSPRLSYVKQLRRYLAVDFYGACGNLTCVKHSRKCKDLLSTYKFYLAFENNQCRDYITEKAFNPLFVWKAVPVVMGPTDDEYAKLMPPNSYIHMDGFTSAEKLAEYIKLLDNSPELYEKYHIWRMSHEAAPHRNWCDLCTALHNSSLPAKTYRDLKGWYEQEQNTCVFKKRSRTSK